MALICFFLAAPAAMVFFGQAARGKVEEKAKYRGEKACPSESAISN